MDCAEFQQKHDRLSSFPLSSQVACSDEYEKFITHMNECSRCHDWHLGQMVQTRGHRVEDFPCVHVAYRVTEICEHHNSDPWECPDIVIAKFPDEYKFGIPIRDGGNSMIQIHYCPWCGKGI